LDFAEYREYQPGDDFRYVDWNLYGRLNKLFVKVFAREEDVPIYVLLDTSHSMSVGEPSKLSYAVRLAGALCYLGIKDLNRVGIFPFALNLATGVAPRGGSTQLHAAFNFLRQTSSGGETSINGALGSFAQLRIESGLVLLLSDMLSEGGYQEGLSHLLYKGHEVAVLHVLAAEDLDPKIPGESRLLDSEFTNDKGLEVSSIAVRAYQQEMRRYVNDLKEFCQSHKVEYAMISTATPLENVIFEELRGVLFR
jgi:uncharacterized protein (DUF58 family)